MEKSVLQITLLKDIQSLDIQIENCDKSNVKIFWAIFKASDNSLLKSSNEYFDYNCNTNIKITKVVSYEIKYIKIYQDNFDNQIFSSQFFTGIVLFFKLIFKILMLCQLINLNQTI